MTTRKHIANKYLISLLMSIICIIAVTSSTVLANTQSQNIYFPSSTDRNPSRTINISGLSRVINATVDNGSVNYSVNGEYVTVYVSGGSSNTTSRTQTDYRENYNINDLPSDIYYNNNGYSGTLYKSGSPYVVSGGSTSSSTKQITNHNFEKLHVYDTWTWSAYSKSWTYRQYPQKPDTIDYDSDGYRGTLSKQARKLDETIKSLNTQYKYQGTTPPYDGFVDYTAEYDVELYYSGTVTKSCSNSTLYRQDYSGTVYSSTNNTYSYNVNLTYEVGTRPSTPTFNLQPGQYTGTQQLYISAESGAAIYYTTDGSQPSLSSSRYYSPVSISSSTTVRAKAYRSSLWSDTNSITLTINTIIIPSTPTGLTHYVNNTNQVVLTWNSASNALGYYLYRNGAQIATPTTNSYTDNVTAGTSYTYYVKAYNSSGTSGESNSITVNVQSPVPSAPTGLTHYVNNSNQVILTWNSVSNASGYYVYRNGAQIALATNNSYTDTLTAGTSYTYYVKAYNSSGTSGESNSITVNVQSLVPTAPSNLTHSISNSQVFLTWNAVSNATGYYVYRNGAQIATTTTNSYIDYITAGVNYTYYVKAFNSYGAGTESNTITVNGQTQVPSAPTGLTHYVNGSNQIYLTWNAVSNATGYYVYRNGAQIATTTTNSYTDYITTGVSYTYYVKAFNTYGAGTESNIITVNGQTQVPSAPTNLTYYVNSSSQVLLTWNSVSNATGYYVYRNGAQIATTTTNSYTDYISTGVSYTYYVKAFNTYGAGGESNIITVNGQTQVPSAPTNLTYYINNTTQVLLTWNSVSNASGYYVYRNSAQIATTTTNSYTDYITAGTGYTYYVKAFNSYGAGGESNVVSVNSGSNVDKAALLTEAKELYKNGKYDQAIDVLTRLLAIDRNIEDGMLLFADCYIKKGDLNMAKSKLQEYMLIYEYPRIINKYAEVCIKRGEYEEARQKLITILPKYAGETYLYKTLAAAFEKLYITGIRVFVYGTEVDFTRYDNIRPYMSEGRTLIPIRALSEALGADVDWNSSIRKATIRLDNKTIEITDGLRTAKVNGVTKTLDVAAQMNGERLMVPLRFVSENFGKTVDWYSVESVVNIISVNN